MPEHQPSLTTLVTRGVVAGLAGTAVMTAFQRYVEMPLTGRDPSYAPANFADKVLPINPSNPTQRQRVNWVTHFALGIMWGVAYGVAANAGLRGGKAIATVFGAVYTGDVVLNTALGLYHPAQWSGEDWAVDVTDKLVQATATGVVFDRLLEPARD